MTIQFKHVMVMVTDMEHSARFYGEGLGLELKTQSPMWSEFQGGDTTIALHASREKPVAGGSPILSFYVDSLEATLQSLIELGGVQEGDIREPSFGKVVALRAPEGTLISLTEPK